MTTHSLLAREAWILRLRFEFGLVELEEIERWADATLLAASDAPYELVELAMANSVGAKATLALLSALGGERVEPIDVVLAAATADPDKLSPRDWEKFLGRIAVWSSSFVGPSTPETRLLLGGYRPSDELTHALHGNGATIESAMEMALAYFKQIVDTAAKFRESDGGGA